MNTYNSYMSGYPANIAQSNWLINPYVRVNNNSPIGSLPGFIIIQLFLCDWIVYTIYRKHIVNLWYNVQQNIFKDIHFHKRTNNSLSTLTTVSLYHLVYNSAAPKCYKKKKKPNWNIKKHNYNYFSFTQFCNLIIIIWK